VKKGRGEGGRRTKSQGVLVVYSKTPRGGGRAYARGALGGLNQRKRETHREVKHPPFMGQRRISRKKGRRGGKKQIGL